MKKEKKSGTEMQNSEKVRAWVYSVEGKRTIGDILRTVEKVTTELTEARRVDDESLQRPITL